MTRRRRLLLLAALAVTAGCGGGGPDAGVGVGVSLELRHTEPLRAGAPVRWTLVLRNDRPRGLEVAFPTGRDGDVVLSRHGDVRYRWSDGRRFTSAARPLVVGPDETRTFALEGTLDVPPGDYDVVATLATDEAVPPAEATVSVVP